MNIARLPAYFISHGGGPWPHVESMRQQFAETERGIMGKKFPPSNMNPPPFDPPYFRVETCPEGTRIIETREDGSEHVRLTAKESDLLLAKGAGATPAASQSTTLNAIKPVRPASSRASLFLKVPFAEKDKAKKLGARWDAERRTWYVPQGTDITPFKAWWPEELK